MNSSNIICATASDVSDEPVIVSAEAYISETYAREEENKLWSNVWQIACREEDIPNPGDFYTYDILNESIIVTRTADDVIVAYHNVCPHRGRRLTAGCGHTQRFYCRYHGWRWNLEGNNEHVLDKDDWQGALTEEHLRLKSVKTGTWAGYVFINLNPSCEPLEQYLETLPHWLDPFEIEKMRYKWRQWLYFPCNWKVAIEAFIESYHVGATHTQLLRFSDGHSWSRAEGRHSCMGTIPRDNSGRANAGQGTTVAQSKTGQDHRKILAEFMSNLWETVGLGACTTQTIVDAAKQMVEVLPDDASAQEAAGKMLELACKADAARGVTWPQIDPQHFAQSGIDWHVFPNSIILHGITFVLGYRARPNGHDPDSCIFEVYVLERFPEGEQPAIPENVYQPDISEEKWRLVLCQDFQNMPEVQRGMKSSAFSGAIPSPLQEKSVINFHRNLAQYMGCGAPRPLGTKN